MPKRSKKPNPRQALAREHTARLRDILRGQVTVEAPQPSSKPPTAPSAPSSSEGSLTATPLAPAPPPIKARAILQPSPPPATGGRFLLPMEQCLRRPKSRVAQLIAKTQRLAHVNQRLRALLPSHLHEHALITKLDEKNWVVQTDSSAWATRLRYLLPNVRKELSVQLAIPVPPLHIDIAPPAIPHRPPPPPRRMSITTTAVNTLEKAARHFTDERLVSALLRLAEHARQRNRRN